MTPSHQGRFCLLGMAAGCWPGTSILPVNRVLDSGMLLYSCLTMHMAQCQLHIFRR